MKRILQITTLALAALTLSACDTLHDLVKVPPADYTGTYADLDVAFGPVCGLPRNGEVHLKISTQIAEDVSVHTITASTVIYDAGEGGETLTTSAEWTVNGTAKNLNSGAIDDFGHVTLKKDADRFIGRITLYNVECVTPATEPGQPDTITYGRVTVAFEAR